MSELQVFRFDSADVRTVTRDGALWLVAKDVAEVLGYSNPQKAIRDHCKGAVPVGVNESFTHMDRQLSHNESTFLLDPQTIIIPERDMYRLVMKSKLPSAEKFEEWVVAEVLPSIRKTGNYDMQTYKLPQTFSEALHMLADSVELVETQKKALELAAPKVAFADAVNDSSNSMDLGVFAKILGTGRTRFFGWLREQGYLMTTGTRPYQNYLDNGYFVVIETIFAIGDTTQTYGKTQITGKGQLAIEKKWAEQHAA